MYHARRASAFCLLVLSWAMTAFGMVSLLLPGTLVAPDRPDPVDVLIFTLIFLAFPTVGFVVSWKRPDNPMGWLLLAVGLSITTAVFSTEYANVALYAGVPLPAVDVIAWMGWSWAVGGGIALPLLLLLFPDGHLPGPRWRPVVGAGIGLTLTVAILASLVPGPVAGWDDRLENPFGASGPLAELALAAAAFGTAVLVGMALIAIVGMVVKLRRSRGVERQQFKWLLYPAGVFLAGLAAGAVWGEESWTWSIALLGLAGVPVGVGIAILRYRLYDIDLVIRRTVVYLAVVAILGALYGALILGLQAVLSGAIGGGTVPVVVSTLVIAALFGPVRHRVREAVDRLFYRSGYDAEQTLRGFSARVRNDVDFNGVTRALGGVVTETVHPTTVGVWLRARDRA